MNLITQVEQAIWNTYSSYKNVKYYIEKWHVTNNDGWNNYEENFEIKLKENSDINLSETLHGMNPDTLMKIAIDLGVDTPDFIPAIASFRNEIKSTYANASATFEKAFKQIEEHPDMAIGLANSALESIVKEIFKDPRLKDKPRPGKTLYDLTAELLKQLQLFPNSKIPVEIKTIGSSLLAVNQSIEKLRSEKTNVHGKTDEDYVIEDPLYTYFIINTVTTIGLFLNSYYKLKFPDEQVETQNPSDDLPF